MTPPFSTADQIGIDELVNAESILIALDFDGVLAPLEDDPENSRMLAGSAEAISSLTALPGTQVALVSGRDLGTLRRLAAPPRGTWLIGSHGAEADFSGGVDTTSPGTETEPSAGAAVPQLSAEESELLAEIDALLAELATLNEDDEERRLRIEKKPYSRTVHLRGLDPNFVDTIADRLPHVGSQFPQLRIIEGHDIVEYSVKTATKGDGMTMLIEACAPDALTYLGDDVTDEDAFAALEAHPGNVCIKIGTSPTRAPWRLEDPEAVAAFLTRLARERGRRTS